ncbi:RNA polymerase sigma factor [Streptomyces sp. HPF1205]|uniref:RNA polymerase sigma factor n=1 Tax=Streptomyces sp. HPF1205 TaxID=2873262 RepID=UPI001CED9695|nr:sigma-70 family RNA polymerase sigma factor [Streptomyces sp. HPF1205]
MDGSAGEHRPPWDALAPLVRAARAGDALAMDEVLAAVTPYVTRLCRPIALSDAEDAVQEALTAIFVGLRGLRDPRAFYAWARTLTVREAVRVARRTAAERSVDPGEAARLRGLADAGDGELPAQVRDVLARMPARHRAVLVLRELEGLDEASAAEVLGVPPGTVKSRLHRARSAFRKAWRQ